MQLLTSCYLNYCSVRQKVSPKVFLPFSKQSLDCNFQVKFHNKHEWERMNRFRDMAIQNYARRLTAVILDLVHLIRRPRKPYPARTKDEAHRMIRCTDMAIRNFPKCEVRRSAGRSVGRRSSILHCSHTLLFATLGT